MPLSSAERQARFRARHKDQQRAAIVHTRRRVDRRSRPQRWRGAVTELLRCKAPMLPGSKHCLTRFRARRPWTPCRPSLILTSTRSLRSTRPAVTVATDDTQWFGRFARLLDGAWPGRRPQGLRCEYRQAPALALDPATQAQRGSDAVLRSACPPPAGCHFYFARRVSFLSCADNVCRSPFEKSQFLPDRNVTARPVDMTLRFRGTRPPRNGITAKRRVRARGSRAGAGLPGGAAQPLGRRSHPASSGGRANRPNHCVSSVAAVAARRLDHGQRVKINIDDGLKRLGCRGASKCVGQGFEPGGIGGLKFDQFSDGIGGSRLTVRPCGGAPDSELAARRCSGMSRRWICGLSAWSFSVT